MQPITDYFTGLDLGKDRDRSALATLAYTTEDDGPYDHARRVQPTRPVVNLVSLIRSPLGTDYVDVVEVFRSVVSKLLASNPCGYRPPRVHVAVDAGGPGPLAVELIKRQQMDIYLTPTVLTAGLAPNRLRNGKLTVPRRDIVANIRFLLEAEALRISSGLPLWPELEKELTAFTSDGAQPAHDDLAIATGLAAYDAVRIYPVLRRRREQPR